MPASMTGFGAASGPFGEGEVSVALKTVNNRFLKVSLKMPDALAAYQRDVEATIRKHLARGTLTCTLRLVGSDLSTSYAYHPDRALAYREQLVALAKDLGLPDDPPPLSLLASLPGVFEAHTAPPLDHDEALGRQLDAALVAALDDLTQSRETEGAELARDMVDRVATIRARADQLKVRAPQVVQEYQAKLHDRIAALMQGSGVELAKEDLAREVATFADRADVTEELTRLAHHCEQFEETIARKGETGRRLEFIAQEMLREANTIGSKCSDSAMIAHVLDIKVEIEKIKEQVQNVE